MNTSYDNQFKTLKNLKWLPFVGGSYLQIPQENRMLIVGESHYLDDTEEEILKHNNPFFTRITVNEYAVEGNHWNTKIFKNLHKALFGNDEFSAQKFWNLVSFYNFIQRPMDNKSKRPSSKEFCENWDAFFEIVKILKPKTCLFIGNTSADKLTKAMANSEYTFDKVTWEDHINGSYAKTTVIKDAENNEIELVFIKHTSQRFTWQKWNEYLIKKLNKQVNWLKEKTAV